MSSSETPQPASPRLELQARAAQQFGHFSVGDARACELSPWALLRMANANQVVPVVSGVYRFAAVPETEDGRVMAALLAAGPGSAIARRTALRLLGLDLPPPRPPDLRASTSPDLRASTPPDLPASTPPDLPASTPPDLPASTPPIELVREDTTPLSIPGIVVHRTRSLPSCDVTVLKRAPAIRLTTATRSLIDVCGELDWIEIANLVDSIICGRHASRRWLYRRALKLRSGRPRVGVIIRLTRPGAEGEFWSWLERTSAALWALHGISAPDWNVELRDERGRIGTVDAVWRPQWVIAELEGLRFHSTPAQRRKDAERFNRLGKSYRVLRFTWLDVVQRPVYVVETVREALGVSAAVRKAQRR